MNIIIESLKRLYNNDSLTDTQIEAVKESVDRLMSTKKISIKEYHYIIGKDGE